MIINNEEFIYILKKELVRITNMQEKEPEFDNWKDAWEYNARKVLDHSSSLSEDELLSYIKQDKSDMFYQIWSAIGNKGTVEKSAIVLLEYLKRNKGKDYELERYHCTEALFKIIGMPDPNCKNELRCRVQWDHKGEQDRQRAIEELRAIIEKKLNDKKRL